MLLLLGFCVVLGVYAGGECCSEGFVAVDCGFGVCVFSVVFVCGKHFREQRWC